MRTYFSLIYLKPNRYSEERIAIGMLGSLDGVPFFYLNDKKLSFGLKMIDKPLHALIRKSFKLLDFDVNKYRNGMESLPLFDEVVSLKYLKELSRNKRGKIIYGEPLEFEKALALKQLVKKYLGLSIEAVNKPKYINPLFVLSESKSLRSFEVKKKLDSEEFPQLISNAKIDLLRTESYFTSFHFIDLNKKSNTLRTEINRYISTINALVEFAKDNSMGKGRHYFVYEKKSATGKNELLKKIKSRGKGYFEVISLKEVNDKV